MALQQTIDYSTINFQDMLRWFKLQHTPKEFLITQTTIFRPTLISYQIYGTIEFYPIIMLFNNITNLSILTQGSVIYYPNINDIYNYIYEQQLRYGVE